jgi:rRNA maturation endonuclease Nob1
MIYESDIQYDLETNRVLECPRCHNELFGEEASYCRICGLDLVNKCIPEPWEDDFGGRHETVPHVNPPDARFCEQCGAPTVYYEKSILKGYEVVLKELYGEDMDDDSGIPF